MKGRICLMHLSEKILKKDYVTVSEVLRETASIAKNFRDINGKYATQKHIWIFHRVTWSFMYVCKTERRKYLDPPV